jgi:hypothetical protein
MAGRVANIQEFSMSLEDSLEIPAFLRRKVSQGKTPKGEAKKP